MTWMVLGAGRSGMAAAKLLAIKGQNVVLVDQGKVPSSQRDKLSDLGIKLKEGDTGQTFDKGISTGLVLSPGVHAQHPYIAKAKQAGIPILSEVDLALSYFKGKIISVTGTNGKSTTVSMIHHLLSTLGHHSALAGNIGIPPSEVITDFKKTPEYLVLELSSYQLEQSNNINSLTTAILNISPDHLARHGTMEQYLKEKWKIVLMCSESSTAFVDTHVMKKAAHLEQPKCQLQSVDTDFAIEQVDPVFSGQFEWHNRLNGYYASTLDAKALQQPISEVIPHLASFRGLSHRFEKVGTIGGATVINDSKATNVDSTLVALSNLRGATTLLLGGQGKGESFKAVKKYRKLIKSLIVFGKDAQIIGEELSDMNPVQYPSLKSAMEALTELIPKECKASDLLFSPGCASFDEFRNFEERGDFFKKGVKPLLDT